MNDRGKIIRPHFNRIQPWRENFPDYDLVPEEEDQPVKQIFAENSLEELVNDEPIPISDLPQIEHQYFVKKILKKRKMKSKTEYLIEWDGYPKPKDYTWEPK
jgi:heat shock protein HspQ